MVSLRSAKSIPTIIKFRLPTVKLLPSRATHRSRTPKSSKTISAIPKTARKKTRNRRVPARAANRAPRARTKHPTRQRQKTPTRPHRPRPLPRQMPQPTMPVQARKKKPSRVAVARAIVARKAMMSKHLAPTQKHPLTATMTTARTVTIPRLVAMPPCLRKSPSLKLMSMTTPTK